MPATYWAHHPVSLRLALVASHWRSIFLRRSVPGTSWPPPSRHRNDDRRGWRSPERHGTRAGSLPRSPARSSVTATWATLPCSSARSPSGARPSAKGTLRGRHAHRPAGAAVQSLVARWRWRRVSLIGILALSSSDPRLGDSLRARGRSCRHGIAASSAGCMTFQPETTDEVTLSAAIRLDRCPVLGVRRSPHGCLLCARAPSRKCVGRPVARGPYWSQYNPLCLAPVTLHRFFAYCEELGEAAYVGNPYSPGHPAFRR